MAPHTIRQADGQTRLMTKIARLYHEHGLRQAEIAAQLSISQAKVSRLLKRAEQAGIIRTIVTAAPGVYAELEEEIERRYGLNEAVVVDIDPDAEEQDILAAIGAGAAGYLEASFSGRDRIGVSSWSQTVLAMVDRMRPLNPRGAEEVVQLLGGMGAPEAQSHSNRILGEFARMIGAEAVYVPAPGIVASRDIYQSLMQEAAMQEVTRHWQNLTAAIMGIGSIEPSTVLATSGNAFSPDEVQDLARDGAAGDICHRVFRADGSLVEGDHDDRIIAIQTEDLLRIPRRVGLAGGPRKLDAIRGALEGRWITTLITDVTTAEALVA